MLVDLVISRSLSSKTYAQSKPSGSSSLFSCLLSFQVFRGDKFSFIAIGDHLSEETVPNCFKFPHLRRRELLGLAAVQQMAPDTGF